MEVLWRNTYLVTIGFVNPHSNITFRCAHGKLYAACTKDWLINILVSTMKVND